MRKFKHKTLDLIASNEFNRCSEGYYQIEDSEIVRASIIENSNDWQEVKEYPKIINFIELKNDGIFELTDKGYKDYSVREGYYSLNDMLKGNSSVEDGFCKIYQVAKSENEVFTVGDKVTWEHYDKRTSPYFTIDRFIVENERIKIVYKELPNSKHRFYDSLELYKPKTPLLISEDGVELFDGNTIYGISVEDYDIFSGTIIKNNDFHLEKWKYGKFSTKEAAEKWIYLNKPEFSRQQILDALKDIPNWFDENKILFFKEKLGI